MNAITIHGGGLAGLAAGIALRNENVPVTVIEAGEYPRHRVCGEFISGRGVEMLRRIEAWAEVERRGVREARTVCFHTRRFCGPVIDLPEVASCVSRYVLDKVLTEVFESRGGVLITRQRGRSNGGTGIVRATGRRAETESSHYRQIGFKVHASGLDLRGDLEMHHSAESYIGLCRLPGNTVNLCGLFRSARPLPELKSDWAEWLRSQGGGHLRARLRAAEFDPESVSVVAGLCYAARPRTAGSGVSIGDACNTIPPLTGNGMSMALESALVAAPMLSDYARGRRGWSATVVAVDTALRSRFRSRLSWARGLQRMLLGQGAERLADLAVLGSRFLLPPFFRLTR